MDVRDLIDGWRKEARLEYQDIRLSTGHYKWIRTDVADTLMRCAAELEYALAKENAK